MYKFLTMTAFCILIGSLIENKEEQGAIAVSIVMLAVIVDIKIKS